MAVRHEMGETGECVRCGAGYPWPAVDCTRPHGKGRGYCYAVKGGEFAGWLAREGETRHALGTTPITRTELIDIVMRGAA